MFASLRHDAFVGGDHQGYQIDSCGPCDHVFDEFLMAGHIDYPEAFSSGHVHVSKSELDCNTPQFFFLQAIRIDSGQGFYKRGFSVVDVAGCSQNDLFHRLVFALRHL